MINTIHIASFKAFADLVEFNLTPGKNLLAYGENGSGKSSLFEALRLFFYQERLLQAQLKLEGKAGEVSEADIKNFLRGYNNKAIGADFTLALNGQSRTDFPLASHACYMLGHQDVQLSDELRITNYLASLSLPDFNIEAFWKAQGETLIGNVNRVIENDFKEKFRIDTADAYSTLKIEDPARKVSPEKDYRRFLNEAKLHLVALLLFFETVKLLKATLPKETGKLLVLDDIVTSLDATNRIFLVNYLVREFADCQILLLTHNVSFFNLVHFKVGSAVEDDAERWAFYNICEVGSHSRVTLYSDTVASGTILTDYERDKDTVADAAETAGNRIRRRFEAVMYEYAKLVQIDQFEEANQTLSRLINKHKPVFVKKVSKSEVFGPNDLLDEIITILSEAKPDADKLTAINAHIADYQQDQLQPVVQLLKEMKMFQKVVLHQLSHDTGARSTFTDKEIRHSITLLRKFELLVKQFKDDNPYGM